MIRTKYISYIIIKNSDTIETKGRSILYVLKPTFEVIDENTEFVLIITKNGKVIHKVSTFLELKKLRNIYKLASLFK